MFEKIIHVPKVLDGWNTDTRNDRGDSFTDALNDSGAFMAQDTRKRRVSESAAFNEKISVTKAGGNNLDAHFTGLRSGYLDCLDFQRLIGCPSDGCLAVNDLLNSNSYVISSNEIDI